MAFRLRKPLALAVAVTAATILSGCVGTGAAPAASEGGGAHTLTIWHAYAGQPDKVAFIDWALKGFQKEHPDVKLNVVSAEQSSYKTKLQTAMSTGQAPDVFYTLPGGFLKAFVDSGQVLDLNDELKKKNWGDGFIPSAMESVTFKNETYAVPIDMDAAVVWYNKKLFASKGWGVPHTWDEFLSLSAKIAADGEVPVALGNKDSWPATFWYQYGVMREQGSGVVTGMANGDANASFGPKASDAAGMLQTLAQKKYLPTGANGMSDQEANLLFMNGKAAMVLNGTWQIGMSADASKDFDLGYFPFPKVQGGSGDQSDAIAGVAAAFAVSKKAADKQDAVDFLRYMTSPAVMKKYVELRKTMVTLKGATTADVAGPVLAGIVKDVVEPAKHLDPFYDTTMSPKAATVYYSTLQGLIEGSTDPASAAKAIDEAVRAGK
ncbi:ABC transporter substrate-binding protein [Microbacterium sp. ASV81]|uniref:Extracellular solute-binding protein n=1 Tax=Microbacterium capsulatum TaxID=3041921 RepID=A0ABU0XKX5_9MICO|nr:extracellular solute-binding protein [Microbacterium sp. ASV81]MDQ4214355.1 extracellular solute-binding protein [Microbacterium sp. ASV81]